MTLAARAVLLDHAAEVLDEFTPRPAVPLASVRGAFALSDDDARVATRRDDEDDLTRRPPSLAGFLSAMAASYDWGTPIRSSSDPSRYGGGGIGSSGFGKPPTALQAREEYALAHRELARVAARLPPRSVSSGHVFDGPAQMAMWTECHGPGALSLHVIKGGRVSTRKGYVPPKQAVVRVPERHQVSASQYAGDDPEYAGRTLRALGIAATAHEVGLICREVTRRVEAAFVAHGWVRARRVRVSDEDAAKAEEASTTVAAPEGWDVEGWKDIGKVVGRSEDQCQRLAARTERPLPTTKYLGSVIAIRAELRAWVRGEIEAARGAA